MVWSCNRKRVFCRSTHRYTKRSASYRNVRCTAMCDPAPEQRRIYTGFYWVNFGVSAPRQNKNRVPRSRDSFFFQMFSLLDMREFKRSKRFICQSLITMYVCVCVGGYRAICFGTYSSVFSPGYPRGLQTTLTPLIFLSTAACVCPCTQTRIFSVCFSSK